MSTIKTISPTIILNYYGFIKYTKMRCPRCEPKANRADNASSGVSETNPEMQGKCWSNGGVRPE